jgi:DNA-binding response OmpR family regulator
VTAESYVPWPTDPGRPGDNVLVAGPVQVDRRRYEVRLHGREVRLTAREFELLVFLIGKRGLVASAEEISEAVWHGPNSTNTVTVHINRLRAKLGDDSHHGMMIRTVRGVGYRLAPSLCE